MPILLPLFLIAAAGVLAPCASHAAESLPSHRLFVTNYRDDTVSVINGDTRNEERVIDVGGTPQGITHRAEPPLVAVASSTASYVTLIDPTSLETLGRIETGAEPEDLVFSHDGKRLYVTSAATKAVHVLDVEKRTEVAKLPSAKLGRPVRLQLSPDGALLYVLIRSEQGTVWVIDTATNERVARIPIGVNSNDFALSTDGKRLVSASFAADTLSVIDTEAREVVATHPAPVGSGLVMHPTKSRVYSLASFDDTVHAVDYQTGAELAAGEFGGAPQYGTTNPAGTILYIAYEDSNRIVAIDTETVKQIWRTGVGEQPADIEYVAIARKGDGAKADTNRLATRPPTTRDHQ